jgi:F-type H+-transporting ATPase subunit b
MKRIAAWAVVGMVAVAGSAHASGMPQLAFGNPLLTAQVVWGAIIFALFYIGVSRYGLPQVDAILEHRAGVIGTDLEQARHAKLRADQAVAELNAARSRAYADSQAAVNAATLQAKENALQAAEQARARLDRQLADSEAQIGEARGRAMASLHDIAASTTAVLVDRLTHRAPDPSLVRDAVNDGLRARGLATG